MSRTTRNLDGAGVFRRPRHIQHNREVFEARELQKAGFKIKNRYLVYKPSDYDDLVISAYDQLNYIFKKRHAQ